ncbi:MAG: TlpA disulfide reductase family protein [Balneolaceae bacterium]|nr:TlpA disulfide reductase family protein [Balneolaceae bacterium]
MNATYRLLTLALVLSLTFAAGCSQGDTNQSGGESAESGESQQRMAPDFSVTTIQGNTVSLEETMAENKPMVVYFTASWCPICAKNWPVLSEVYPDYQDRLDFIAIGIDPTDTREVMTELAREENFTFPLTWGHPDIMLDFGVQAQATTVGISREGRVVFQRNKTALSEQQYRDLFDRLVN